ncbi:MAG: glycosyltransferase family 2 protein, partial [Desulfonauticus sp.]|nr:glycosyltransferase family 2 protein [Desulfonauticus sp.]
MTVSIPITIIIPVYNKWDLTKNCLLSLKKYTPDNTYKIIVVDNNSTDKTPVVAKEFGRGLFGENYKYVRLNENINFGPACNLGAKLAKTDLLFFLNNDTVVTPNWLEPLLDNYEKINNVGALGPLLLYPDNTVQHLGVTFSLKKQVSHLYRYVPHQHPVVKKRRRFQVITGAAFLISKKFFWELDGFYEEFRNGFEDVDLCAKIIKRHKLLTVLPESIIYHLEGQTSGRHSSEKHNSRLLTQRCVNIFIPDQWRFYLEDGYQINLTRLFNIWPTISSEREELLRQDYVCDLEWYWEKLNLEPFWWNGYKEALGLCLKHKKY